MTALTTLPVLKMTVAGHTNTGKTSLLRSLTRDVNFGEVSDRPATTRHVEGATLLVRGRPLVEIYDTPGLEDSIGLLEHLDALRAETRRDWVDVINDFLASPEAAGRFEQEAKALRQVIANDVALYVIDARDPVLAKYRDEVEILGRCATPIVPVLNFVADADARTAEWRQQLTRVGMHAIVDYDTVVINELAEQRLFEKVLTLLDPFRPTLEALIDERAEERRILIRTAADMVADLLIDVAAYTISVPDTRAETDVPVETLRETVRRREQSCVDGLLDVFRFRPGDVEGETVPLVDGRWGLDLFTPAALKAFGIRASSGAAVGGAAGLTIDAMTGGLSLGAAAALGAAIGAVWGTLNSHGRRIADLVRGQTELRVDDTTLRLLYARQSTLVDALLRRGHASQSRIRLDAGDLKRGGREPSGDRWLRDRLPDALSTARLNPDWSRLGEDAPAFVDDDTHRAEARQDLAKEITERITAAMRRPRSPA